LLGFINSVILNDIDYDKTNLEELYKKTHRKLDETVKLVR